MWSLFGQRKALDKEVYDTLTPGSLYGGDHRTGWQPEDLVRYLFLANIPACTFFSILMTRVDAANDAYEDINAAVWLTAVGTLIAFAAWTLFRLSRSGEARALKEQGPETPREDVRPDVRAILKRAATQKLLAFRVMIVSGISFCVGLYTGIKGLIFL